MSCPLKAPDVSYTGDQQFLKPMADPIIGNTLKAAFQLVRYANLISSNASRDGSPVPPAMSSAGSMR